MEPTTAAGVSIATTLMEWGSWIITGGFVIAFIKVVVDYAYVKRDVKRQGEDIAEIKKNQIQINKKIDKVLECTQNNSKGIAVLEERTKNGG